MLPRPSPMRPRPRPDRSIIALLLIAVFVAGFAVPRVTAEDADTGQGVVVPSDPFPVPSGQPPREQAPASTPAIAPRETKGILAVGDDRLHDASRCLARRGVVIHPRIVRSAEELIEVVSGSARGYAAIIVHLESDPYLVDGHIMQVLNSVTPRARVIWSTILLDQLPWGEFAYEDRVNASVRNAVGSHADGRVLDWRKAIDRHPDWRGTMTGQTSEGCRAYARKAVALAGKGARD